MTRKLPTHLNVEFRPYRRPFKRPLRVAWGSWAVREGIILRVEDSDSGQVSFGEVAPLEPFGTESAETALRYLIALPKEMNPRQAQDALDAAPPATAFGLSSAFSQFGNAAAGGQPVTTAVLLSLDGDSSNTILTFRASGARTYKLKLGLSNPEQEREHLSRVWKCLEDGERLRLDPNQSWNREVWEYWEPILKEHTDSIEFIEEPFQPGSMEPPALTELARNSAIPLALDESLSRNGVSEWIALDWPGYYIIKPSLMGDTQTWMPDLATHEKVILSSAFETGVGLNRILQLAEAFPAAIHGLGTQSYFNDSLGLPERGSVLSPLPAKALENIWNNLPND